MDRRIGRDLGGEVDLGDAAGRRDARVVVAHRFVIVGADVDARRRDPGAGADRRGRLDRDARQGGARADRPRVRAFAVRVAGPARRRGSWVAGEGRLTISSTGPSIGSLPTLRTSATWVRASSTWTPGGEVTDATRSRRTPPMP